MTSDLSLRRYARTLDAQVAAGTAIATPAQQTWTVGTSTLRRLEIVVPTGHNGLTGIAFRLGGTRVIPFDEDEWLVGNGRAWVFSTDLQLAGGIITVVQYNTGDFAHTHHLVAHLESLQVEDSEPVVVLPTSVAAPPLDLGVLVGPDTDEEGEEPEDETDVPSAAA